MIVKNGIEFQQKQQKFRQGVRCDICNKKLQKGEAEYVSSIAPVMHLCVQCAKSNKNIPGKKGTSIFMNNRFYMFVEKGINGTHHCDLTGAIIKQGTPCWWSSKKDDPENKCSSYILTLQPFVKQQANNQEQKIEENVKQSDLQTWYDESYVDIGTKHFNEDTNHFCSFIDVRKDNMLKLKNKYLQMQDYLFLTDKKYQGVVFWIKKGVVDFVPYERLMQFLNNYEISGKLRSLKIEMRDIILERYVKEGEIWKRILMMQK